VASRVDGIPVRSSGPRWGGQSGRASGLVGKPSSGVADLSRAAASVAIKRRASIHPPSASWRARTSQASRRKRSGLSSFGVPILYAKLGRPPKLHGNREAPVAMSNHWAQIDADTPASGSARLACSRAAPRSLNWDQLTGCSASPALPPDRRLPHWARRWPQWLTGS